MREDVRRKYAFTLSPPEDDGDGYIPGLYHKSDYEFPAASKEIESALDKFEAAVRSAQQNNNLRRRARPNLSPTQWRLVQFLRKHNLFIVIASDKNLGPCILDRIVYIERGCSEHLGNARNYRIISENAAINLQRGLLYKVEEFLLRFYKRPNKDPKCTTIPISTAEFIFLHRARQKNPKKLARFRMIMKVHKDPWKMRPIVCCAGTLMNDWSRWLDYQLQKLKHFVPTYLKDGEQLLNEVRELDLPPNAILFTADATAMYNNIDTDHALEVIGRWLDELEPDLPDDFPLEAVKYAMYYIMKYNVFGWGTLHLLQLVGTAMGTSSAVMWATMYYGYHEVHSLLPRYNSQLFYFKRYIDDIFGVWLMDGRDNWVQFCRDVNDFGILRWEIDEPSKSVNFLDLTLTIRGRRVETRTYQKKMNLYLYLPPSSAHPRSCIDGTIFGCVRRYFLQNTHRSDYVRFVVLLYRRLLARGWDRDYIKPVILRACSKMESIARSQPAKSREDKVDDLLFVHLQFHPEDISRRRLRHLYDATCGPVLESTIGARRIVVAYSRPPNIGEYVTQAELHEAPWATSHTVMGEFKQGLAP